MRTIRASALGTVALALAAISAVGTTAQSPEAPEPATSPVPFPPLAESGALAPGTYYGPLGATQWTVTVPAGWEWFYDILWADLDGRSDWTKLDGPGQVAFGWWQPANVFADPCHWKDSLADPPIGPTVDDLATAFVAQLGRDGSGPTDVILGGYPAKKVEMSVPTDLDVTTCDEGVYREFLSPGESLTIPAGQSPDPAGPIGGRIDVWYILEVDGTRWLMRTWHHPETSEEHLAELDAMLASIVIDPPTPSPAASPSP